jgi:hypothetical protein
MARSGSDLVGRVIAENGLDMHDLLRTSAPLRDQEALTQWGAGAINGINGLTNMLTTLDRAGFFQAATLVVGQAAVAVSTPEAAVATQFVYDVALPALGNTTAERVAFGDRMHAALLRTTELIDRFADGGPDVMEAFANATTRIETIVVDMIVGGFNIQFPGIGARSRGALAAPVQS